MINPVLCGTIMKDKNAAVVELTIPHFEPNVVRVCGACYESRTNYTLRRVL